MRAIDNVIENIKMYKDVIDNEATTITALIFPFFQMLGYDTSNPHEVRQQFTADIREIKNNEKVDLAIMSNDKPLMVIECKACNKSLERHDAQLSRYFQNTDAKFGVLTNGIVYHFFTDLKKTNCMDDVPFLKIDLLNLKDEDIAEIMRFHKAHFSESGITASAQKLKNLQLTKDYLHTQAHSPSRELLTLLINEAIKPKQRLTSKLYDDLEPQVKQAFFEFLNDQATERLQNAMHSKIDDTPTEQLGEAIDEEPNDKPIPIEVTLKEFEAYAIVRSILRDMIDVDRLAYRHAQRYMVILFDDNKNKRICRLWFRGKKPYITTPDENMNPVKREITSLNDIYNYAEQIREVCSRYL